MYLAVNTIIHKNRKAFRMEEHPLVSIISVNFNELEATMEMLSSLEFSTYPNFEVIIVDNASRVNPQMRIGNRFPDTIFIRSEENLGFAGGNNLGIKKASGEFLFFINNDTEIVPGLIFELVSQFSKVEKLGAISPLIYFHPSVVHGREKLVQYAGASKVNSLMGRNVTYGEKEVDNGQFRKPEETSYTNGAAMMISREVLNKVGPWPEQFFLYYEELDWCERIRNEGYKIYFDPRARIYHKESSSVGSESPMKTYFHNRNRILFMRRNKSLAELFFFWPYFVFTVILKTLIYSVQPGKWKHIKSYWKSIQWNIRNDKNDISDHGWNFVKN